MLAPVGLAVGAADLCTAGDGIDAAGVCAGANLDRFGTGAGTIGVGTGAVATGVVTGAGATGV